MRNKKFISALAVAIFAAAFSCADDFSDALHELAVQVACRGHYTVRPGDNYDYIPGDYYTPEMARRFKNISGILASTSTFNGVCFDYALAAYHVIDANRSRFNRAGMYEDQFFMASIGLGESAIKLRYPTTRDGATTLRNGVYVTTTIGGIPMRDVGTRNVSTHEKTNGTPVTNHAWIWIMRYDGMWFWIDPTWTDNLGYVVWGYIDNSVEVQLRPDETYCINYRSYLNNLPTTPAPGSRKSSSGSGYTASRGGYNSDRSSSGGSSLGYGYGYSDGGYKGLVISAGYATPTSTMFSGDNFGVSLSVEDGNRNAPSSISIYQLDFYRYNNNNDNGEYSGKDALLFDYAIGWQFARAFALYGGAGLGFSSESLSTFDDDINFAWKVNGGIRVTIKKLNIRAEVQYVDGMGVALGAFVGWGF